MTQLLSTVTMAAVVLGLGIGGCRSSQTYEGGEMASAASVIPPDSVDSELEKIDPQFTITRISERRYSLRFRGSGGGASQSASLNALHSLASLSFQIYAPNGRQLASIATQEINTSGTANTETEQTSLTAFGGVEWDSPEPLAPGTFAIAILRSDHGALARRVEFPGSDGASPAASAASVAMLLDVRSSGSGVEFTLTARRAAQGPADEYLPSGEKYRIELRNDVGETIWSSSTGKVFTMAIGPMAPGPVGSEVKYREFWNGRDEQTRMATPPGVYRIIATIPAKPTPYILREEFTWSGR